MESEERGEADVDDQRELLDDEFNLEGEFHEDDLETSGALVCSTPAPAVEIPTIVVDEAQETSLPLIFVTVFVSILIFRLNMYEAVESSHSISPSGAGVRIRAGHLAGQHGVRAVCGRLQAAVPAALRPLQSGGDVLGCDGRLPLQPELLLLRRRL